MKTLTEYAKSFIGVPYNWGGETPMGGFDCSGLVQEILSSVGADPPGDQTAQKLFDYFMHIAGSQCEFVPGALAFFGKHDDAITHVGFMVDEHRMIEAGGGGKDTTNEAKAIYYKAFVRIRPVLSRSDLQEVIMPKYPEWLI
jgi:cell wall-associated NlpC family hydrolase